MQLVLVANESTNVVNVVQSMGMEPTDHAQEKSRTKISVLGDP